MASLYIHIPFCEHKCIYCDFYSIAPNETASRSELPTKHFVDALSRELKLRARDKKYQDRYETLFLGGGTPSLLSIGELDVILKTVRDLFSLEPDAEVTIEANPGTVTRQKLESFRSLGINRISIGVQSFHEDDLQFLTRIHSSEEAKRCVRDAFAAGFDNVSLDLMFSLPGQTRDRWQANLDQAVELSPTHISCYSLIVEPNTPLSRMVETKQVAILTAEDDASLYELTIAYLAERGYEQYEVSNFAKPSFKSRHNRNYWNHSNYIGFGPSAHSFWTLEGSDEGPLRWWNVSSIVGYLERLDQGALPVAGSERLSDDQLLVEEVFLGLRSEGIDIAGFRRRFGKDLLAGQFSRLNDLVENAMAVVENGKLRLTPRGYMICDEICASLRI